jgi:hypothetical protein
MQSFTKRIIVEGFSFQFSFHRMYTVKGINFHISVVDKNNRSRFFNMEQTSKGWRIINAPKLPDWLMMIEKQLGAAIDEALSC